MTVHRVCASLVLLAAMLAALTLAVSRARATSAQAEPAAQGADDAAPGAVPATRPEVRSPAGERLPSPEFNFWFPEQASTVAPKIDFVFDFITWISIFFFVLIVVLMVYFVVKYHTGGHGKATSEVTHNTPLELTWTIIPLILVIGIFYVGMQGYLNLRSAPAGSYEIHVTGQKWFWDFTYPTGFRETGVLRVPVGRPVKLLMQSQDVLHSFYIPAFRVKQDVVPGRITFLWFEATKAGEYDFFCAEYCGKDHSQMVGRVIAYEPDEFEEVLEELGREFERMEDWQLPFYAGSKLYARCASCHALTEDDGTGPGWGDLWERTQSGATVFKDGTQLADLIGPGKQYETPDDYIMDSILRPGNHIVANFTNAMPTFQGQLQPRQITAMLMFIKGLQEHPDRYVGSDGKPLPVPQERPAWVEEEAPQSDEASATQAEDEVGN